MPFRNLNKRLDQRSRFSQTKKRRSINWKKLFIILFILFVVLYLPIRGVYQSGKKMVASAKGIQAAAKQENLDDIRKNLKEMKSANDGLNMSLNFLIWVRIIPFLGGYYADARHFSQASAYELQAASQLVDSLEPYKTELGFTGHPTPGTDKIAQMVKILDKVLPQVDKVQPLLKKASDEVSSVDVNKYPETVGKYRLRSQIDTAKNFIIGANIAVTEGKPALEIAPSALGEPSAKNYLLIFQNDKELRATGGFMTAYAFLNLDKGRLSSTTSDDIYRLDEKLLNVCLNKVCPLTPPEPISRYLPEANGKPRTTWSMRDSNISPDVPTSMKNFERMYNLLGDGAPFDGIILIDTHVVEELIKITGPVEVFGTKYSAETDKRCNCPNVIYELENYAQIIEKGEKDRKAILGTLMQQILARSLGSSTDKMPEFINAAVKLANSKDIIFYMKDQKTEDALTKLGWTGAIDQNYSGDFLMINDSNFAGGKSNMYVEEDVTYDVDTNSKKAKLTIVYKNPQKYTTWLNGINRDYVRVYVPKGSKLTTSKGSEVKVTTIEEELGKTVFEGFLQVRPGNSTTYTLEYDLPQNFTKDGKYPLLIQKQPGTKAFNYTIKINGKTEKQFKLTADNELMLGI